MLNSKAGQFLTLILLGLIWGSSFILMKKGLLAFNSWQVAGLRLFFAGLIAVPFLVISFRKIQKKDWPYLALAGFLGNGFPAFMFTYAQQTGLESSLVGALNALTPAFTLIVGLLFFGLVTGRKQLLGLFIGLAGAMLMIFSRTGLNYHTISFLPFIIVFTATLFYGININIIKSKFAHIKPVLAGLIPLSIIAFPATAMVFSVNTTAVISNPIEIWGLPMAAIFILGTLGTAISLFIFNVLVQKTNALFASAVNYMLPFVAAFWGIIDGEAFGFFEGASLILIIIGITLIRGK